MFGRRPVSNREAADQTESPTSPATHRPGYRAGRTLKAGSATPKGKESIPDSKGSNVGELLTTLVPVELVAIYGVINAWNLNQWLSLVLAVAGALMAVGLAFYDYRIKPTTDKKAQMAHMFIAPLAFLIWSATFRSPFVRVFGIDPTNDEFGASVTAIALVFTAAVTVLYKVIGKADPTE